MKNLQIISIDTEKTAYGFHDFGMLGILLNFGYFSFRFRYSTKFILFIGRISRIIGEEIKNLEIKYQRFKQLIN
jgi:hypothetical protein